MIEFVMEKDIPLLLEICHSPEDCLLNHKVAKTQLKRLIDLGLIEVETRNISPWIPSGPPSDAYWISNGCPGWNTMSVQRRKAAPTALEIQTAKNALESATERRQIWQKQRVWNTRTEIHACLTPVGHQWATEFRDFENRVLSSA